MRSSHFRLIAPGDLKPYPRNARTHSRKQVRQIADSIRTFGWTNPVLIDAEGGIIAGHGRVEAAKLLSLDKVPTLLIDHLSEAQKRAYILADNKIGDLFKAALQAVRYTSPRPDTNRARWPDHPLWETVAREVSGDLFEMVSGAEPGVVKDVYRDHICHILQAQIEGLSATLAVAKGIPIDQAADIPRLIARSIMNSIRKEPEKFERNMERAQKRYHFVCEDRTDRSETPSTACSFPAAVE